MNAQDVAHAARARKEARTVTETFDLAAVRIDSGGHDKRTDGMCFNEAVAYFRGLPHSDAPACVSPVIRSFTMRLNDRLSDEHRQMLVPYIPRVVGTNTGSKADEDTRRFMCMDWVVHEALPGLLRQGGLTAEAELLEGLVAVTDADTYAESRKALRAVREATWERRSAWRAEIGAKVKAEIEKQKPKDAAAVAVAAAAAAAAADAVADAAADAVVAAAADADAVAVAAAVAVADAAAVAAVAADASYWERRDAAYRAAHDVFLPAFEKAYEPITAGLRQSALGLLDRLIEVGKVPVAA